MARAVNPERDDGPRQHAETLEPRRVLELWIALARFKWSSMVLVPSDPDGSAAALARALADMGQRLSFVPVTAIVIDTLEYGSALALADLQQHLSRERTPPVVEVAPPEPAPASPPVDEAKPADAPAPAATTDAMVIAPNARLIIAIPAVTREPLGLPAAQEADAVVLTARMGRTHLRNLRRTLQLIGRNRVIGTVLMRTK